jgi:hypothetical protein
MNPKTPKLPQAYYELISLFFSSDNTLKQLETLDAQVSGDHIPESYNMIMNAYEKVKNQKNKS